MRGHEFLLCCLKTYQGETPNLDVGSTLEEPPKREWLGLGITTISVDTVDDELGFSLGQKFPTPVCLVWEVDEGPVTDDTKEACKRAFDDEDPCRKN